MTLIKNKLVEITNFGPSSMFPFKKEAASQATFTPKLLVLQNPKLFFFLFNPSCLFYRRWAVPNLITNLHIATPGSS